MIREIRGKILAKMSDSDRVQFGGQNHAEKAESRRDRMMGTKSGECWSGEWEGERSFDRMLKINRIEDGDGACIKDKSKASANGAISVFTRIIFF